MFSLLVFTLLFQIFTRLVTTLTMSSKMLGNSVYVWSISWIRLALIIKTIIRIKKEKSK